MTIIKFSMVSKKGKEEKEIMRFVFKETSSLFWSIFLIRLRHDVSKTHLDLRKKNFDFIDDFFLFFPFAVLQMMASSIANSYFDLDFCDFDTPKIALSLDFIVVLDACNCCCCFFDVVKFCKKLNITLRVIAHSALFG